MTKRLNMLESRALIRRRPDPNDGQSTTVALTSAGKRLVEEILPEHSANESRLVSELSARDRAQLASLLEELAIALGDYADATTLRRAGARRQLSATKNPSRATPPEQRRSSSARPPSRASRPDSS
jgi:hypothetical protein